MDKKQYVKDREKLSAHEMFMKYATRPLQFRQACQVAQPGYFDFLAASYAAKQAMEPHIIMSDDEWAAENGGVPASVIARVIKPAAAQVAIL